MQIVQHFFIRVMGLPTSGHAYWAWCPVCPITDGSGVNWQGPHHIVGLESAPNYEALMDAERHDAERHPA